jgi:hypothetical protein
MLSAVGLKEKGPLAPLFVVGMDEGGTIIEYDKEDPEIRRRYEETLRLEGVEFQMPPVSN